MKAPPASRSTFSTQASGIDDSVHPSGDDPQFRRAYRLWRLVERQAKAHDLRDHHNLQDGRASSRCPASRTSSPRNASKRSQARSVIGTRRSVDSPQTHALNLHSQAGVSVLPTISSSAARNSSCGNLQTAKSGRVYFSLCPASPARSELVPDPSSAIYRLPDPGSMTVAGRRKGRPA